jgi:hypothetical protein
MRQIKWVGHPSPFDDPNIRRALYRQQLPFPLLQALRRFEHDRRICATPGRQDTYHVGIQHGFSRTYIWYPHQTVEMTEEDWEKLCRNPLDRYLFLDVTDFPVADRPPLTKAQWQELLEADKNTPKAAVALAI